MRVLVDLDGVLWRGDEPLPGAIDALARLCRSGASVFGVTNNAGLSRSQYHAKFDRVGFAGLLTGADVISSADAVAGLLQRGERVVVCGAAGLREAVLAAGAIVVEHALVEPAPVGSAPVGTVVVGWNPELTYDDLTRAVRAVLAGARLIAANADPTIPSPAGPAPGAGATLAAIVAATGAEALVAGKPHGPMVDTVRAVTGATAGDWMVGDRYSTDGAFASALGIRFALVRSEVTEPEAGRSDMVVDSFAEFVERLLSTVT